MKDTHYISPWVVYLVIWQLAVPTFGVEIRSSSPPIRLAILRMGETPNTDGKKAFRLLEKRVQRWLEGLPYVKTNVKTIEGSFEGEKFALETERVRLNQLSDQLVQSVWDLEEDRKGTEELLKEMRELRLRQQFLMSSGAIVQKALVAEGVMIWRRGDRENARQLIEAAAVLNPNLSFDRKLSWDTDDKNGIWIEWGREIKRVIGNIRRACIVKVSTQVPNSTLSVNGFEFGSQRDFHLASGGSFLFRIRAPGFEPKEMQYQCIRPERKLLAFALRKEKGILAGRTHLSDVSQRHQVQSIYLIQALAGEFRMFLYTPSVALDEISVTAPIRVADLLQNPRSNSLPVLTDQLTTLLSRHQANAFEGYSPIPEPVPNIESQTDRWYNDWKFWAISGAVVGGVIGIVVLTQGHHVQTRLGLTVKLE